MLRISTSLSVLSRIPVGPIRTGSAYGAVGKGFRSMASGLPPVAPPRKSEDVSYRIGFAGNGGGAALLMMRVAQKLNDSLLDLSASHRVRFSFHHLDNSANLYGALQTKTLQSLTQGLLRHLGKQKACDVIVLGNASSVAFDRSMRQWATDTLPGKHVVTIVKPTADRFYSKAQFMSVEGRLEKRIGILGTPTTIASHQYPAALAKHHAKEWGDLGGQSVTVVVNTDDRFPGPKVYLGGLPIVLGSVNEQEILKSLANQESLTPVLYVHIYSPKNWDVLVENREGGHSTPTDRKAAIRANIQEFLSQSAPLEIQRMSVMGLVCTEYPLLKSEIIDILRDMKLEGIKVMGQTSIAESTILPIVRQDVTLRIEERDVPLSLNDVQIRMSSCTTVRSGSVGPNRFLITQQLCNEVNPHMAKQIQFSTIRPIPTVKK